MSLTDQLHVPTAQADGTFAAPVVDGAAKALREATARNEALTEELDTVNALLAKPLNEILADREHFKDAAAAWDAFGAMWVLSQRAMKRVALDLAAQQGVSEDDVVARAMSHANAVLNGDGESLGGTLAEAQLAHIGRHKAFLRKQFRQG